MEVRDLDVVVDFEIAVMAGVYEEGNTKEGRRDKFYLKKGQQLVNTIHTHNARTKGE
jgi:hypothetical protein